MRQHLRRAVAAVAALAGLTVGITGLAGPAAALPAPAFEAEDSILPPGEPWIIEVHTLTHTGDGLMLYAMATQPLTGETPGAAGLPTSMQRDSRDGCTTVAGTTGVFACPVDSGFLATPSITVGTEATDGTKVYVGYAFVPNGGDVSAGVHTAQTAAALPSAGTYGTLSMTVFTAAHAAANTVTYDTPAVASGGAVRHTLHLHVNDPGDLYVHAVPAPGEPAWQGGDAKVGELTTTAGAVCTLTSEVVDFGNANVSCRLSPGEQTLSYTVTAPAVLDTRRVETHLQYDIYRHAFMYTVGYPDVWVRHSAPFEITGTRAGVDHDLVVRTGAGQLSTYGGTGDGAAPFARPQPAGAGWQVYGALTKLAPVTAATPVAPAPQGAGDMVGRDASGVLWYYRRQFGAQGPFAPRTKVGAGWNIYASLAGAGDLTGDGRVDLLARDGSGVLWLYRGTASASAPFAARTKVGAGWNIYGTLAGSDDLTGDGRVDLLARDGSGVLWLYRGTGSASAPFAARTRVGPGWNVYGQVSVAGDLTGDGRPDLVARDAAGVLWLYRGTSTASAPFASRTRIGSGWNMYSQIL